MVISSRSTLIESFEHLRLYLFRENSENIRKECFAFKKNHFRCPSSVVFYLYNLFSCYDFEVLILKQIQLTPLPDMQYFRHSTHTEDRLVHQSHELANPH